MENSAGLDPDVVAVLACLWEAARGATGARPWSTAKLGKRSGLAMSVALRTLARLEAAGLVATFDEDGRRCVGLSDAGKDLCRAVFGA